MAFAGILTAVGLQKDRSQLGGKQQPVEIMQNWVHPGFRFPGERIDPGNHEARRRLAGYMARPIALERVRYRPETGQVIYYGRQRGPGSDASPAHIFPALDFLAALCTHIPDSGHGGQPLFETEEGKYPVFIVRLPEGPQKPQAQL